MRTLLLLLAIAVVFRLTHRHTQSLQRCVRCSDLSLSHGKPGCLPSSLVFFPPHTFSLCSVSFLLFSLYISIYRSIYFSNLLFVSPLLSSPMLHVPPALASSYLFILSPLDSSLLILSSPLLKSLLLFNPSPTPPPVLPLSF